MRRRFFRAVPEDRVTVGVHHSGVRALGPAHRHRLHVARQVHVEGAIAKPAVEPAEQPGQAVVRLDVVVRVIEVRLAELAAARLVRARVVRDVRGGARERLGTRTARAEYEDVHGPGVYSFPAVMRRRPVDGHDVQGHKGPHQDGHDPQGRQGRTGPSAAGRSGSARSNLSSSSSSRRPRSRRSSRPRAARRAPRSRSSPPAARTACSPATRRLGISGS